jgi:hypothetical protein
MDVPDELPAGSVCARHAPVAQLAEAADSNPARCGFESHLGHQQQLTCLGPYTSPVKFLIERRLKANGQRLKALRQELAEMSEQRNQLSDEAEDHRLRALLSDSPFDALEAKESGRHANAFGRRRAEIVTEIAKLETKQDDLLDQLSAAR